MNNKKKVLGVDPLSWIKQTKEEIEEVKTSKDNHEKRKSKLPKFETYEVKLTLRLNEEQLSYLVKLERDIMKNRSSQNKIERITKNSIIRAVIDSFKEVDFNKKEISDERELKKRIKKSIGIKNSGLI